MHTDSLFWSRIFTAVALVAILAVTASVGCGDEIPTPAASVAASAHESQPIPRPLPSDRETVWSAYLAQQVDGEAEYRLPDASRIDILTEQIAYEVEWCDKWEQSIGQAVFYSASTHRRPGVWLLKRGPADDEDYLRCLATVCNLREYGLDFTLRVEQVGNRE